MFLIYLCFFYLVNLEGPSPLGPQIENIYID